MLARKHSQDECIQIRSGSAHAPSQPRGTADAPPSVVARDMPRFPGVVERRFQYGENTIGGGLAFANAVGALVGLAVVWLAAGLGAGKRWLFGKAVVPVLDPPRS